MKDISERAFPKGHFEGRAFPKGERAKGMKGIVHKLEFSRVELAEHHQEPPLVSRGSGQVAPQVGGPGVYC